MSSSSIYIMKFGKAEKQPFFDIKYTPPPGYYESYALRDPQLAELEPATFSRQARFIRPEGMKTPGPGQYHKPVRWCNNLKKQQEKIEPLDIRINSVPSIPTGKDHWYPYEPTQNKDIMVRYECNKQIQKSQIEKQRSETKVTKSNKYKFKPLTRQRTKPDLRKEQLVLLDGQYEVKQDLSKKQKIMRPKLKSHKQIDSSNMYLQLILIRERQMRPYQSPPPGFYYDPKASALKIGDPTHIQQFSSSERRFKMIPRTKLGPGQYHINEIKSRASGGIIGKEQRLPIDKDSDLPGPGNYFEQAVKAPTQKKKLKYPNPFGSGKRRFQDEQTRGSVPGPGQYSSASSHKPIKKNPTFSRAKK